MGANPKLLPTPLRNSYWVLPGKVLAGEHPGGTNREATRERLQRLIDAGVECFIDLTETGEVKPYDGELPFSIEYLRKPIRDHSVPAQRVHMVEILDCLHDAVQSGRCVYVHCRAGIGRTGTVIGCFLAERSADTEAALDELNRLWQQSERAQSWGSVPETDEQEDFVRKWKPRRGADGSLAQTGEWPPFSAPATAVADRLRPPSARAPDSARQPAVAAPNSALPFTMPTVNSPDEPAATGANPRQAAALAANSSRQPTTPAAANRPRQPAVAAPTANSPGQPAATAASNPRQPSAPTSNSVEDDLLSDPDTLSAVRTLRDRFLGTMLGLAVGDAVAAATQFRRAGTFTPVGDMLGGGPFDLPRGGWSDDTSMALCLADSLLACEGFNARDQMERYRQWQQEGYLTATGQCVGITASTTRAIAMSQWRRQAFSGSHDPSQLDPEPLSRAAAAVLFFFDNPDQAAEQATEAARTTCQAPAVLDACRALARALHAALSGQPKAVVLESAAVTATSGSGRNGLAGSAPAALTAAAAAFGATGNFRDAVLYAANLGGDSDVVAAVTGQLAGAFYTVKAIPTSWHNGLMQKELIAAYADKLLAHAMLSLSA
jgi:ADP-ribosyl-[dinitrogen reductase] hydrolase